MVPSRVWFVTGSSTGFGRLIVEKALEQGDRVVATLRKPSTLSDLIDIHPPTQLAVVQLDVTSTESIQSAFSAAQTAFGRIDIVVNNAGVLYMGELESLSKDRVRSTIDVNFWGATNVGLEAIKFFREVNKPQGGLLLHISSCLGVESGALIGHYAASKFATEGFFEAMVKELDPRWNIQVQMIHPGSFRTAINTGSNAYISPPHPAYQSLDSSVPVAAVRQTFTKMAGGEDMGFPEPQELIDRIFQIVELKLKGEPLPLYAPIGVDSIKAFKAKIAMLTDAVDKFEVLSKDLREPGQAA